MSCQLKCYRVWFKDGTALLVDAHDENEARRLAIIRAYEGSRVSKVECLDNSE